MRRLHQLREETGETARNEFRRLAWLLARDEAPRVEVDGGATGYTLNVEMSANLYAGLVVAAARFGIAKPCIGELVLSYYPKDKE